MKPPCYNRPPFAEGRWHYTGEWRRGKPVMRWYPRWFADRCATHDGVGIGPNNEGYPAAHGWDCNGCQHDPRRNILGVTIVEAELPPGIIAAMGNRSDWVLIASEPEPTRDIDAFEPIQRAKAVPILIRHDPEWNTTR